jgi:hypothetical protein
LQIKASFLYRDEEMARWEDWRRAMIENLESKQRKGIAITTYEECASASYLVSEVSRYATLK